MALAAEQKAAVAAANRREQAMYERRKGEIQESIEQARTLQPPSCRGAMQHACATLCVTNGLPHNNSCFRTQGPDNVLVVDASPNLQGHSGSCSGLLLT